MAAIVALSQESAVATPGGLNCDFNANGICDAADYVVWRNHLGESSDMNLNGGGDQHPGIDHGDYNVWKFGFGDSYGSGSLAPPVTGLIAPEPTSAVLLFGGSLFLLFRFNRRL